MKRNYKQLFAICKKHGLDYKDKVAEFTNGRTESLKELTDGEYKELMIRLQRFNPQPPEGGFVPKPGDKMRKKMISIAGQMQWGTSTMQLVGRINNWCLHQKFKKPLMEHNEEELGLLVTIFEQKVLADYFKGLNR